jgi:hypothetical protein
MKRSLAIAILLALTVGGSVGMAQESQATMSGNIPGSALKYIRIAERVFAQKKINVDDYIVVVREEEDKVTVYLRDPAQSKDTRGGGGLAVDIDKKTKKVIKSYYTR